MIGELAFGTGGERDEYVKVGVLVGSLVASLLAALVLRSRNQAYQRIQQVESADADDDGVPDVYEAS